MKSLTPAAVFAAALLATGAASASTIGLPGTTGLSSTWDTFPSPSFTGDAPDTAASTFTATLDYSTAGGTGLLLGGGDRLYTGAGATGTAPTVTINGTATSAITGLSLVVKFTSPSVGTASDYYTVSLNGVTTTGTLLGTSVESQTYNVYEFSWSGLSLASGSNFSIVATGTADHVSQDAFQVSSVPEASSAILGSLAAGALLIRRRRN